MLIGNAIDPATDSRVTVSIADGKVTVLTNVRARLRRSKKQEMPPTRRAEIGASATSAGVRGTLRRRTVACAEILSTIADKNECAGEF